MDNTETQNCQSCKREFIIESEDFKFYDKIKVPAPTWCPECRMIRRFSVVNIQNLYSYNKLISPFSEDKKLNVVSYKKWYAEEVSGTDFARDYDFSTSFFEQFSELQKISPRWDRIEINSANCSWCFNIANCNNCYLLKGAHDCEKCMYANRIYNMNDSVDCEDSQKLEFCYDVFDGEICYKTFSSVQVKNIQSSAFLFDCRNCSNCLCSTGLRHKHNYFLNEQLSKEQFEKIWGKFFEDSNFRLQCLNKFEEIKHKTVRRSNLILNSDGCSGDVIFNSRKANTCFVIRDFENVKFGDLGEVVKDAMDITRPSEQELTYEVSSAYKAYNSRFCFNSVDLSDCEYCETSVQLKNCFACVGLKNKSYCILNKQYEKDEYFEMVKRIKVHMDEMPYKDGRGRVYKYGEFFPVELSPFAYNETVAQEYFPLTEAEVIDQSYKWKSPEERGYKVTIQTEDLLDDIKEVDDSILKEVVECQTIKDDDNLAKADQQAEKFNCTKAFKITSRELDFYRRLGLSLPHYCPNCRHQYRIKNRNSFMLYKKTCMKEGCDVKFETTYAPDSQEIVYCKKCYQEEVN